MDKIYNLIGTIKEPFLILMVGLPMTGKSFAIKKILNKYPNITVISRDEILMELSGTNDYNKAFKTVDQKEVDKALHSAITRSNVMKENVIIDMTNISKKRRKQNLEYFDADYFKVAIVLETLSDDEYERRNKKRMKEENKFIPDNVMKRMKNSYKKVEKSEGFDKIIYLK